MKVEENDYLVIYPGHNGTTLLYQRLLNKSCRVELVSTPSKIYYGCSQSIKFNGAYMDIVRVEIGKINIKPKGVYRIVKRGKVENYEKV